jgi:hypothetical protein
VDSPGGSGRGPLSEDVGHPLIEYNWRCWMNQQRLIETRFFESLGFWETINMYLNPICEPWCWNMNPNIYPITGPVW